MGSRPVLAVVLVVALGAALAGDGARRLEVPAPLTAERDGSGPRVDLPPGTLVSVLETSGDRVRVRVEGWIPASALPAEVRAAAAAAAVSAGVIEGTISLDTKRSRKRTGAGATIWLLPAGTSGFAEGEDEARLDALATEMARLEADAKKALEGGPTFTEATRKHDEIRASRRRVERERDDLVASVHARHQGIALKSAVASEFADERGSYRIEAPHGAYILYARFLRGDLDVEWVESVSAGPAPSRLDLDESNARHLAP
jgi:hypothetical protein